MVCEKHTSTIMPRHYKRKTDTGLVPNHAMKEAAELVEEEKKGE